MKELFEKCFAAATAILKAEKEAWPGCEGAQNIVNFGGSTSSSDNRYSRAGTTKGTTNYDIPSFLGSLVQSNANSAENSPALAAKQQTALGGVMDGGQLDSWGVLGNTQALMSPTSFTGSSTLSNIAARDPFSSQFEEDTQAAYEQRASDAMAQVASGPDAVRGGAARTPVAQGVMAERLAQGRGMEVRNAQMQDAAMVGGAAQVSNNIESGRRGLQLQAQGQDAGQQLQQDSNAVSAARGFDGSKLANLGVLQLASELLGAKNATQTDNTTGLGAGGTTTLGGGLSL